MRDASEARFPMTPYSALFAVIHRIESGTGFENERPRNTLISQCKRTVAFTHVNRGRCFPLPYQALANDWESNGTRRVPLRKCA